MFHFSTGGLTGNGRRSFLMIDAEFWFTGELQIGVDLGNRHRRVAQGLDLEAADQGGCPPLGLTGQSRYV